ncbi:hypothetical protein [Paenarthrobacter nitroguajacolicus]|uniref:hypothetical protein n=1 Tax=Paenarthrobacter nitroguajacolicus TaxID=211146 RepID=UPI002861E500|nr:hypothetical protein [Paenarthrobacter nitroguajacolicus]MDR6639844.1 hypothetical protein [Paenarthrobacter nitroguajacolicus]
MKIVRGARRQVSELGKAAAYSELGTSLARRIMSLPSEHRVSKFVQTKGLDGSLRRIASESLPPGLFFAKLTISNWEKHRGKQFRLLQDSEVAYGNEIEPPARGFPLEYRNIVVTSNDVSRFSLDIDAPYELKIGRGAFTTPQQLKYDHQYGVEQHGDVFYSLRGNSTNPKKLLITFPGFGPSTSRISYAVSYLKEVTKADLKDTLMVCFQDRYLAAGSYMMVDSAGRSLYERVWAVLEGLRSQYDVDESQMLFFGASKGGSIAINYAKDFPQATLLLAVPQMNLPYYFNKPFFRDNLFRNASICSAEQPEALLRQYFSEGRKIHYFYTNSDELSNHSLIELAHDVPNLTKYRVDGGHSAVARAALPSMMGLIRTFLAGEKAKEFKCENVRSYARGDSVLAQARVDSAASRIVGANWYLEGTLGRTKFLHLMTEHSYRFVKFTSDNQVLAAAYDPIEDIAGITAWETNGTRWSSTLPEPLVRGARQSPRGNFDFHALNVNSRQPRNYVALDGDTFGRYRYRSLELDTAGDTMEVHFVKDIADDVDYMLEKTEGHQTSHVAIVEALNGWALVELVALRFVIASKATRLRIVVHDVNFRQEALKLLSKVDWKDKHLVTVSPKQLESRVAAGAAAREKEALLSDAR